MIEFAGNLSILSLEMSLTMLVQKKRWCLVFAIAIALISFSTHYSWGRGLRAQHGIRNFGKVTDVLYRGAQPDAKGIENLEKLGIKSIINLRMPDDAWKPEAAEAKARGILYTNVPLNGFGRPTDAQIRTLLGLIDSLPGPVFIHCKYGCDRTGMIVACYRLEHDQWPLERAMAEAVHHGLSSVERAMKQYVLDFANVLKEPAKEPTKIVDKNPPTPQASSEPESKPSL